MDGSPQECLVCTGTPSVVVAVANHTLRRLIVDLLGRDGPCWQVRDIAGQAELAAAVAVAEPDLVILDTGDFARFCRDSAGSVAPQRVVVIGPEPDAAYEHAARRAGAGAWLTRDRVGEDLSVCMCRVLGCTHGAAPRRPPERLQQTCQHNVKGRG